MPVERPASSVKKTQLRYYLKSLLNPHFQFKYFDYVSLIDNFNVCQLLFTGLIVKIKDIKAMFEVR